MTDDAAKKKRELEHELTLTMTAQVSCMKLIVLLMSDLPCITCTFFDSGTYPYPPTHPEEGQWKF